MRLHTEHAPFHPAFFDAAVATLTPYISHLAEVIRLGGYDAPEASINLSGDSTIQDRVKEVVAQKKTSTLTHVFVVGIGGSNLGTQAVYDALYTPADRTGIPHTHPRLLFIDTVHAVQLRQYIEHLLPTFTNPDEVLVISISKSGNTTETIANTEILINALNTHFATPILDRVVIVTDEGSPYFTQATEKGITCLTMPPMVGGRYSVLSAVGLLPLLLVECDIQALVAGARDMRTSCVNQDIANNPAALSAVVLAQGLSEGKIINDNFFFEPELESLGKWYRQLMGESIGKQHDNAGREVFRGITPTVSIGSTDLHSVGQLYLGGPRDKITTFVYSSDTHTALSIPVSRMFPTIVEMIDGKTTYDIMSAIRQGVQAAYRNNGLPYMEIELTHINPYTLGAYLQYNMIEMMYLARLLDVNAFDQPQVELYKRETRALLLDNTK